jgi:hypothetical protein
MYTIFLILHIISAGIWIALAPAMTVVSGLMRKSRGTPAEYNYMRVAGVLGLMLGNIGGIGILVTGPAMVGIHHWPWFPFDSMPWLAWKQVIYIVILLLSFGVMVPASKKTRKKLAEELQSNHQGPGASEELRAMFNRQGAIGMLIGLLVLTNIILGTIFSTQLNPRTTAPAPETAVVTMQK